MKVDVERDAPLQGLSSSVPDELSVQMRRPTEAPLAGTASSGEAMNLIVSDIVTVLCAWCSCPTKLKKVSTESGARDNATERALQNPVVRISEAQ